MEPCLKPLSQSSAVATPSERVMFLLLRLPLTTVVLLRNTPLQLSAPTTVPATIRIARKPATAIFAAFVSGLRDFFAFGVAFCDSTGVSTRPSLFLFPFPMMDFSF